MFSSRYCSKLLPPDLLGTGISSQAFDVALLCLEKILNLKQYQIDFSKVVATMMFPLLLILPKVVSLNLSSNLALEFL